MREPPVEQPFRPVRDGVASGFDAADLPELRINGLDAESSRGLLMVHGRALSREFRDRILREAAGNPLALIELPAVVGGLGTRRASQQQPLPLPSRLEAAFASRLTTLDAHVRWLLLLAALGEGKVEELNRAAEELLAVRVDFNSSTMAVASGLGVLHDGEIQFRHPLMRSAVHQAATVEQRRQAHAALARTSTLDWPGFAVNPPKVICIDALLEPR